MEPTTIDKKLLEHGGHGHARSTVAPGADPHHVAVPTAVKVLGACGLLPFVAIAAALWVAAPSHSDRLAVALIGYGAVILSFMGAVHWGLAIGSDRQEHSAWYILGVLPALTAWFATMLSPPAALVVLAIAFAAVLAIDRMAVDAGLAPPWYRKLRQPLTAGVVASLALGVTALWAVGT